MSKKVKLKRELGLFEITVSGVGMILGAGNKIICYIRGVEIVVTSGI